MMKELNCYTEITELFDQESWDSGDGPLPSEWLEEHGLLDVTHDSRWFAEFEFSPDRLGVYYSEDDGDYYVANYVEHEQRHELVRIGSASDLLDELGIEDEDEEE